jgi:glyoxylase-like metal-dependent hydrolase (beta-lactamase superfamily II)
MRPVQPVVTGGGRHNPGMSLPAFVEPLDQGLYAIDTGFHRDRFDAAYLMVQDGRAAFIDTGTNFSVPRLLGALEALGLDRAAVDWVIPTHVHLDHAGGVGLLMHQLPQARALVHPRGARHLIDPTTLYQGALAVYGQQEMDRAYGQLQGVDAARVVASADGMTVDLAGRALTLIDTPGHARHHHCIWDEATRGWFTGDTFGLSYREFDTARGAWIMPTSTPVQFEPEALRQSIQRLVARSPEWMYLTHYGRVGGVPALAQHLLHLLENTVSLAHRLQDHPDRHNALKAALHELYVQDLRRHGAAHSPEDIARLLSIDIELNAQGIAIWLDRQA